MPCKGRNVFDALLSPSVRVGRSAGPRSHEFGLQHKDWLYLQGLAGRREIWSLSPRARGWTDRRRAAHPQGHRCPRVRGDGAATAPAFLQFGECDRNACR